MQHARPDQCRPPWEPPIPLTNAMGGGYAVFICPTPQYSPGFGQSLRQRQRPCCVSSGLLKRLLLQWARVLRCLGAIASHPCLAEANMPIVSPPFCQPVYYLAKAPRSEQIPPSGWGGVEVVCQIYAPYLVVVVVVGGGG